MVSAVREAKAVVSLFDIAGSNPVLWLVLVAIPPLLWPVVSVVRTVLNVVRVMIWLYIGKRYGNAGPEARKLIRKARQQDLFAKSESSRGPFSWIRSTRS